MASGLQGGFLNKSSSTSKKCVKCGKKSGVTEVRCSSCEAVHCKECTPVKPCVGCNGMFCLEGQNEATGCSAKCVCDNVVCDDCQSLCSLCNMVLCRECEEVCNKCGDVFCADRENFVVKCEYCSSAYCLICCAKKTTCDGCSKKPSRRRLVEASGQLKRIQDSMASAQANGQSSGPFLSNGDCIIPSARKAKAAAAEAEGKTVAGGKVPGVECKAEAKASAIAEKVKGKAEGKQVTFMKGDPVQAGALATDTNLANVSATTGLKSKKKKKKKKKSRNSANANSSPGATGSSPQPTFAETSVKPTAAAARAGATAAAAAATSAPASASGATSPFEFTLDPDLYEIEFESPPAGSSAMLYQAHDVDDARMDHSVIKKWVLSVAAGKTKVTVGSIRRYFHGRVDPDVIDSYLEVFNNNCRDTVIQCAEFLNIFVPQEEVEEEPPAPAPAPAPPKEEDVNDDLVNGAFGAKEREKIGDYLNFAEHPLEKRANEAYQNDCKDLRVLQSILDEAKGQSGLSRMRKMLNKMIKRIKATQEEDKKLRQEHTLERREIPQQLHPAYANKQPAYTSFQPPHMDFNKEPDAIVDIPPNVVGWVIGKAGTRINDMQYRTNASMWVDQNFPPGEMRKLHIHGSKAQVRAATKEVEALINSAPVNNARPAKGSEFQFQALLPGDLDIVPPPLPRDHCYRILECPHALVGYLIGKKGAMIKRIKVHSNANIEVYQHFADGVPRKVYISGAPECVEIAVFMVEEVIASGKATELPPSEASSSTGSSGGGNNSDQNGFPTGSSPMLGFSNSQSKSDSSSPVNAVIRDFGDLGGLGNGATTSYAGVDEAAASSIEQNNGYDQQQREIDTQTAIDRLHQGLTSARPGGGAPQVALPSTAGSVANGNEVEVEAPAQAGVGSSPHVPLNGIVPVVPVAPNGAGSTVGAHQEYIAQQEALLIAQQMHHHHQPPHWQQSLLQQQQQQQQIHHPLPPHHQQPLQHWQQLQQHPQHWQQQHMHHQQHLQWLHQQQQQQQLQLQLQAMSPPLPVQFPPPVPAGLPPLPAPAPPVPSMPIVDLSATPQELTAQNSGCESVGEVKSVEGDSSGIVEAAPSEGAMGDSQKDGEEESPSPFASVEELLASVGFLHLLPNFLEQEFDVNAIALMQDRDFEEINVPKGPQLKIQRACREAGLGRSETSVPAAAAAAAAPASASPAAGMTNGRTSDKGNDNEQCQICFEGQVKVTFLMCGHQICCVKCGNEQVGRPCPICRAVIKDAKIFYQ